MGHFAVWRAGKMKNLYNASFAKTALSGAVPTTGFELSFGSGRPSAVPGASDTDRRLMTIPFAVRGEYIQLDQLLKATGLCESGGAAHAAIAEGRVRVDAVVDTRKRAKLRPGQSVTFAGETVELVAE